MCISVIIPMYNEEKIVPDTLCTLAAFADGLKQYEFEFLFSDDGSKDGCGEIVRAFSETDKRFRLISAKENRGKGAAIRQAVAVSRGDVVLYTDCDLAYGTEQMEGILSFHLAKEADVTIGSRSIHKDGYAGYTAMRKLASRLYGFVMTRYAGCAVSDSQTGLKCFRGEVARTVFAVCEIDRFAFDLEVLSIAMRKHYSIKEYPVCVLHGDKELSHTSSVHLFRDAKRMLSDLRKMKKRLGK